MAVGKMRATRLRVNAIQTLEDEDKTMTLPEIISGMNSPDPMLILAATKSLRRIVTKESNPPVEKIIEAGLVKLLVTFLSCDDKPILQYEAVWTLTNIVAETSQQTHAVVEAGAVPHFIRLLTSPEANIVESCVWALGNIVGDGVELRDFVIESGILTPLLRLVDMNAPLVLLRTVTWVILNLCCNNNPPPKLETTKACLSALVTLIRHKDNNVLADTCGALSCISDGTHDLMQQVVESPAVLSRLVELLGSPEPRIIIPALQTIGNIVSGDDSQTQAVIDCNILKMLAPLLQHSDLSIKDGACWTLSNISSGSSDQIQAVINSNLLPLVAKVLTTGDYKSQIEAAWVIISLTERGTLEQINHVVKCGALKLLCDLLTTKETSLLNVLLDGICSVLETTNKLGQVEPLCVMLTEIGGLDKIEKLQKHENSQVCNKSYEIIHKFFSH